MHFCKQIRAVSEFEVFSRFILWLLFFYALQLQIATRIASVFPNRKDFVRLCYKLTVIRKIYDFPNLKRENELQMFKYVFSLWG